MRLDVFKVLEKLISFPSVSTKTNVPAARHLQRLLKSLGFRVETTAYDDENGVPKLCLVGKLGSGTGGLSLISHVDVVPAIAHHWSSDPFKARI